MRTFARGVRRGRAPGLEALTLRAVVARADVSHGTVVFHFKRKRELLVSLVDRVLYRPRCSVFRPVARITRPSERCMRCYARRWTDSPRIAISASYRLLDDRCPKRDDPPEDSRRARQYREGFGDLAGAIVNGEFGPPGRRALQSVEGPR